MHANYTTLNKYNLIPVKEEMAYSRMKKKRLPWVFIRDILNRKGRDFETFFVSFKSFTYLKWNKEIKCLSTMKDMWFQNG